MSDMLQETIKADITVVGAGLSGVNAAIAAARLGQTVTLVHNRPVLGGNSSSEVRVWVCGATAHGTNRYARETGIMGELFVENQYRNIDGNPYMWDLVLLEAVRAEPNIRLLLNTDVHEVEAEGDADNRRILSVTGWMMGSERRIRLESEVFLDCTGDGLIGFLAGAKYRIGREARSEHNEEWAPEVADDITLGSTLLFYTKDAGRPVRYHKPSFAIDIEKTSIPLKRVIRSGDNGCAYWWIEWGGELDIVHDNERIRDELWGVIYGVWDYIKNSGQFDSENMTLEWVGSLPGKREYRRFVGDYVLNQNDILAQRPFEDRVAFGGWSIDLHPPQGVYSTESGSKHLHADGIYHIPFRSLYSVNVSNLLFAGRNISATHVAFGTTRVMATCAVGGEAAGTGAALCVQKKVTPRTLHAEHLEELLQTMLRQDASIIGIPSRDPLDLARQAQVKASSTLTGLAVTSSAQTYPLASGDVALLLPVDPALNGLELLIDAQQATTLTVEAWNTGRGENYVPHTQQATATASVAAGQEQWVSFDLTWAPDEAQNVFVIIRANDSASVHLSAEPQTGVLPLYRQQAHAAASMLEDHSPEQLVVQWSMRGQTRRPFCFRLPAGAGTEAFRPENVTDGFNRPFAGPHLWSSEPLTAGQPEWLELSWSEPQRLGRVEIIFNDDVNEDLINLHHHRTDFELIPELVKDYRIEARIGGQWQTVVTERDNRKRKRVHALSQPVAAEALRLVVESTNGAPRAEVVEVRAYA
ncbi:FAD-dependent oxidoreductase [Paenibacillus filicis]|uniref:FAD-dependent oxidoreductase n=1 Tax=Paenibacillus filicis TaxID=669464 RepID=A0ABU9DNG6_9BACL